MTLSEHSFWYHKNPSSKLAKILVPFGINIADCLVHEIFLAGYWVAHRPSLGVSVQEPGSARERIELLLRIWLSDIRRSGWSSRLTCWAGPGPRHHVLTNIRTRRSSTEWLGSGHQVRLYTTWSEPAAPWAPRVTRSLPLRVSKKCSCG